VRKSRYTDEQVAFALKQAELGTPVAEVCRKMAVSEATFFAGSRSSAAWARPSYANCGSSRRKTRS
jgi:hypothetical protein